MSARRIRDLRTDELRGAEGYKLLTGLVVPRPIGWIGSVAPDGTVNVAPYSFFNAVSGDPPMVTFSCGHREPSQKDTAGNVGSSGEFTVNIVNADTAEAMNATSASVGAEVSEFELAGLTPVASELIAPPRVAEAVAQLECRVTHHFHIGRPGGGNWMFVGEVLMFHVDEALLDGTRVDQRALRAIGRHAGNWYSAATDLFEMPRPE